VPCPPVVPSSTFFDDLWSSNDGMVTRDHGCAACRPRRPAGLTSTGTPVRCTHQRDRLFRWLWRGAWTSADPGEPYGHVDQSRRQDLDSASGARGSAVEWRIPEGHEVRLRHSGLLWWSRRSAAFDHNVRRRPEIAHDAMIAMNERPLWNARSNGRTWPVSHIGQCLPFTRTRSTGQHEPVTGPKKRGGRSRPVVQVSNAARATAGCRNPCRTRRRS
jgi:hypothetical protein